MTTSSSAVSSPSPLSEIQNWRNLVQGGNPALPVLANLEENHLQLRKVGARTPFFNKRVELLEGLLAERHSLLFEKTFSYKDPGQNVRLLEQAKEKLAALCTLVNFSDCSKEIYQAYKELPASCRNQLAWAVWFNDGSPDDLQYGEKKLEECTCLLKTKQPYLLYLKGNNIVEQLLFQTEQQLAIEKAKETQERFGKPISEQEKKLETLEMAAQLEEFERLTVLYRTASNEQRDELFRRASLKVQEWITTIQASSSASEDLSPETPLYAMRGAHFAGANTSFRVFAPYAKQVSVVLTASGKEEHCIPMKKNAEGIWEVATEHAFPGRTYRYLIEDCSGNKLYRTDPFGVAAQEKSDVLESVVGINEKYLWQDSHWMQARALSNPLEKPRVIYELHLESWRKQDGQLLGFRALTPKLIDYCQKMHYTHVEFYDLLENPGGWGYKVRNYFTPNHRMGTPEDFKFLVDQLHQKGIHVIVDWIPTHYSYDSLEASLYKFDGTDIFGAELSDWITYYFNFSRPETRRMLSSSAQFWLDEMHADGLRVDAVGALVKRHGKYIPEAILFLKNLNATAHKKFPGVEIIAEDTDGFPNLTKPISEGGLGFDLKWGVHWSNQARSFMQTPFHERSWDQNHRAKIVDFLNYAKQGEKQIFSHSHDDSANRDAQWPKSVQADNTLYKIECAEDKNVKFADLRNFFAWQFLAPHRGLLIHMGDEFGQKRSWNTKMFDPDGALEWQRLDTEGELDYPLHVGLQHCVSALGQLYCANPAFWRNGEQSFKPCCDHQSNSVVAYQRHLKGENGMFVVHNFSNGGWSSYDIPLSGADNIEGLRSLKEIFNSNAPIFGGSGAYENSSVEIVRDAKGTPTHLRTAIPPLSTLVFEENLS